MQRSKIRHAGVALFNGSSVLSESGRNLELATRMLQEYLAGSSKTEEAPAFVAHTRLARLDAQTRRYGRGEARARRQRWNSPVNIDPHRN